MKRNNILILVLIGLILLFVASNYFKKNSSTNFKAEVIQLDSSQVDKISIYPPSAMSDDPIIISRKNNQWEVAQGNITSMANQTMVKSALGQLKNIKTERLVAKTKDKWSRYELTDSLARWVEIQEKGRESKTKLYFGKTTYGQPITPNSGRRPTVGSTYFRMNDMPETYAIKSGLSNAFNRKFNAWRNAEFIKLDKDSITQLKFESVDKTDFFLTKTDSIWTMGILPTDSTKVVQYLNRVRNQSSSKFVDGFIPKKDVDHRLTIRGKSMKELIVKAYRDTTRNKFILNSSQHPNVFVESDSVDLFGRLFVNQDYFESSQD